MKICFLWTVLTIFSSLTGNAKVTLSSIWGDNMVLQQKASVVFSGSATPSKVVEVITSWDNKRYKTQSNASGNWTVTVTTSHAGGPYTISFSDGEVLKLKNILLGEVWFCSGQSNMEMAVKGFRGQPVFNTLPYIAEADAATPLRLFTVEHTWNTIPQTNSVKGHWTELSPKSVADFSAVGYFFGEKLQKILKVPVGLINCSWSMSTIQAWMSPSSIQKFSEIPLPDKSKKDFGWVAGTPTLLYNGMVNPWKGFPIKGVLWYQGEANTPDPDLYYRLFPEMVNQWRSLFNNTEMPFYYVQLPPFKAETNDDEEWAKFRQIQLELLDKINHVEMITTGDAGSEKFIHTPYKIKIGERLAYLTLEKTYQRKGYYATGPLYHSFKLEGDSVFVNFKGGEDGLTPELQNIEGFELVDATGKVFLAKAEIIRSSSIVKVWAEGIHKPMEVRYCFHNYYKGELGNNLGVPAAPFRIVLRSTK